MSEKELYILIETLVKQLQVVQESQEKLRQFVTEQMKEFQNHYTLKEQFYTMQKDIDELKEKLEEVKQTIIENQEAKFKQTITVQASILALIIGGFITSFFIPQILHLFGH